MGTSGSSSGAGSGTPLVPTWLDEPPTGPLPGSDSPTTDSSDGDGDDATPDPQAPSHAAPAIRPPPVKARFQGARTNFSRFASSGGTDRGALRRAVRDYVQSGTRGRSNAVRRMGVPRNTASGVLGVLRGFSRDGVDATLRRLNLDRLIGRPPEDVFLGLTDSLCPPGGPVDEGIVRDAWCETVAELDGLGIDDLGQLTPDLMREFFLTFVAHSIEMRLFQEIGANGLKIAPDLNAIEAVEAGLHSYIRRSLRDSFSADLSKLHSMPDARIREIVDQTYLEAWSLLEAWGDSEE